MSQSNPRESPDFAVSRQIDLRNNLMLAQNDELIQKLNKKIDRRLNIGYYCEVPASRKQRNYQSRKIYIAKGATPKKKYPIIKRKKKDQKVLYVDCEQNTDAYQLMDDFQNTSRVYTEKKEEPEVKDNQVQWTYQVPKADQSAQCSVEVADGALQCELVQVQDASIQYQDPRGILELKEVYIQCEQLEPEQQPIQQPKQEPKQQIVVESREVQCDRIEKVQQCLQFDQTKPQVYERKIQIDLPDLKQLEKIQNLEKRLQRAQNQTQRQKQRQAKITKAYKSRIQMLKLREEIGQIEKQIEVAQINEKSLQEKRDRQQHIINQKRVYEQLRKRDRSAINKHFQNRMAKIITNLKAKEQSARNEPKVLNLSVVSNAEQPQTPKQNPRQEIRQLQNDLKYEMKKRMRYQQDCQETQDSNLSYGQLAKIQSNIEIASMQMRNLFPNPETVDRCFAGTIIKNISNHSSPNKLQANEKRDYRLAKITRAFCERRSEANSTLKQIKQRQELKLKGPSSGFTASFKSDRNSSVSFHHQQRRSIYSNSISSRYVINKQRKVQKTGEMKRVAQKLKNLLGSDLCVRYLYSEEQKMSLGIQLFAILNPGLALKRPINILKSKDYIVYSYISQEITHFIIFYHSLKYIFYGQQAQMIRNQVQFYSNHKLYKSGWGIQYNSEINYYNGEYRAGEKHGFGLQVVGNNLYEGFFVGSTKTGTGRNVFPNGDVYQGEFADNLAHGEGVYRWQNGQKYEGYFEKGKRHGYGKHKHPNGDLYEGFYADNLKQGKGRYHWSDGRVYEGLFKNDLKCGQGKLINPDDSYFIGIWNNDVCTYVCRKIGQKMPKLSHEPRDSKINM